MFVISLVGATVEFWKPAFLMLAMGAVFGADAYGGTFFLGSYNEKWFDKEPWGKFIFPFVGLA